MGAQIGTAFVRVRPETSGFRNEVQSSVRGAFSGIGKLTAGLFVVGGVVEGLKSIASAAAGDQAAFAVLDKAVENAGASNTVYGHTLDDLLGKQARLRGFTDEELASSFTRIVSATHDSTKAYRDLGLAEDVARARHIGVAQAAIAISKAEQGVTTALQRLGIVVRPTTANVDALKQAHDSATAAGVKFTKQQEAEYKAMLAQAKAQDAVASRAQTISVLQQRFGGVAATFANTASGSWERLKEQVHQFEEFLGGQVLPGLTAAGISIGGFFRTLSTSASFKEGITQSLDAIKTVAQAVGPALLAVGRAIGIVTHSLGVPTILAAAVAYKTLGVAQDLWTSATKRWAATQTAARAAQAGTAAGAAASITTEEASSAALTTNTAALTANTAAILGNAAAAEARIPIYAANGTAILSNVAANEALTASTLEQTAAQSTQIGVLATLRTGLSAFVGGPVGLAVLGVAALAGGIAYLLTRQSAWDAANARTARSLDALGKAQQRLRDLSSQVGEQHRTLATDATAVAQARLGVAQAQQALANTTATRGSLEYQQAALAVTSAIQQQQAAIRQLADDQRHLGALQAQQRNGQEAVREKLDESTKSVADAAEVYRSKYENALRGALGRSAQFASAQQKQAIQAKAAAEAVGPLITALNKQATSLQAQFPLLARNTSLLAQLTQTIHRVPTRHETEIILNNKDAKAALADLVGNLIPTAFNEADLIAKQHGVSAGSSWVNGFAGAIKGVVQTPFLDQLLQGLGGDPKTKKVADAAAASAKTLTNAAKVAQEAAKNAAKSLADARQNLADVSQSAKDSLQSAADSVTSAQEALANAIRSGGQQITDAVNQAKQNLFSIGDRLASDIDAFLQKRGSGDGLLTGATAKEFKRLTALIRDGGGTADIQRQAAALSSSLQAQSARAAIQNSKKTIQTQIEDLVDSFTKGPQNQAAIRRLNQGIAKLLRVDKITRGAVAKELGSAAADDLFAQIDAINKQARASAAGPRRPGTGREPTIVRPEQTVIDVQRQIADAQRTLQRSQLSEAQTQTAELKKIAKATQTVATKLTAAHYADARSSKKTADAQKVATRVK